MIGMSYFTAVLSSARYWPKPPSPVIATIGRSGAAAHAPMAAGIAEPDRAEIARHEHRLLLALEVAAERIGVVADVDRDHRVGGYVVGERGEQRCRRDAEPAIVGRRAVPSPPARSLGARRHRVAGRSRCDRARRSRARRRAARRSRAMSPSTGTVTGWKRPSASGSRSTWMIGLYDAMPVWFANDAPNTSSRSDSFMSHDATGVPLRPSTPHGERVVVGDDALGLERRDDRRVQTLGERVRPRRCRRARRARR